MARPQERYHQATVSAVTSKAGRRGKETSEYTRALQKINFHTKHILALTGDVAILIVTPEAIIRGVERIPRTGRVNLEVVIVIVRLVLVRVDTDLVGITEEGNGGIETDRTVFLVVDRADLESVLVSADETGLLTSVAGGSGTHD